MKKITVLLGGVCVVALLAGGVWMMNGRKNASEVVSVAPIATYWDKNTDINQPNAAGQLPLIMAAKVKDAAAVKYLLEKGARLEATNKEGENAVEEALRGGDMTIIGLMLEKSSVLLNQPQYMSAAIESGNVEAVKTVLQHGGLVNAVLEVKGKARPDEELDYMDPRVTTPLKKAVNEGKSEIVGALLEKGAEGASYFLLQELNAGHVEMVQALAKKSGSLRQMSAKGTDLLTSAAAESNPQMLEFLLNENVGDVNSAMLRSLVYRKADNDYEKAAEMFLDAGAVPTSEILEVLLKKNQEQLFEKAADCLTEANVIVSENKFSLLRYAVEQKKKNVASYLLKRGADMWAVESDGYSAFEKVVTMANNEPELFQLFKSKLKNIDESGYKGQTLLMLLAQNGFYELFKQAIDEGADVWKKDNNGKSVLMYAAEGGNFDIVRLLIAKGDNLDKGDKNGTNPLMYAAQSGNVDICRELLYHNASLKAKDNSGRTAIMYAAGRGKADVVEFLINSGESVQLADDNRKTVLMYAVESGDLATFELLKAKGIDVTLQDRDGVGVVSYAVRGNNAEIVRQLINMRADKMSPDHNGYQPYVYALKNGNKEIADILGVRIDGLKKQTLDNGWTLPMYALTGGNLDLTWQVMRQAENLINKQDNQGVSFMMLLARDGRPEMLREAMNLRRGNVYATDVNGKSVLMYAAESEIAVNLISIIGDLARDASVDRADKNGKTALMYAVDGPYNAMIKQQRLMQSGANPMKSDINGKTVLMYAVGNSFARVDAQAVRSLIHNGADVSVADKNGKTALMYAAANKNVNIAVIETLLAAKADVNAKDNEGKTVLMYAAAGGDISKFRLLYEAGAEAEGKTKDGKTVQDFADAVGSCFAKAVKDIIK